MRYLQLTFIFALALLVAGCGGETKTPQTSKNTAAGPYNVTADGQGIAAVRGSALERVNAFRAENGLGPLRADRQLEQAAIRHAQDMTRNGFMSHSGSDGSSPITRVRAAGYCYTRLYENVSIGYRNVGRAITAWFNSAGHRANILKADATEIGIAGQDGGGWAMVLARPC